MPVNRIRGGVLIQLVAHIDQRLNRGYVYEIGGSTVKDDGFEGGFGFDVIQQILCVPGAWIVPGTILRTHEFD